MSKQNQLSFQPMGWIETTLGELITILRGVSYPKNAALETRWEDYVPILRANNIQERISFKNLVYVPPQYVKPEQFLQVGDIVVAASSGSRHLVGKAAQLLNQWKGSFGTFCYALRPFDSINPRFVGLFLQTPEYRERISELSSGININNLRQEHILGMPCLLPPLAEQQRIVDEIEKQFSRLDAAVEILQRVELNLERLRAATLKAAVEGQLVLTEAELARAEGRDYESADLLLQRILRERRASWEERLLAKMREQGKTPKDDKWKNKYSAPETPDTENLPELPEGWTWTLNQQLGEIQLGRQRSPKNRSRDYPTKYIRAANLTEDGLDLADLLDMEFTPEEQKRYQLQYGDIILSEASGSPKQVGKPAIWRDEIPLCCFQNTVIRIRVSQLSYEYLHYVYKHFYVSGVFAQVAGGVGINHLSAEKFSNLEVPLPPLAEQQRIVAEVDRLSSLIVELKTLVTNAQRRAAILRKKILRDAFAGKLVPQDHADVPANILLERIRTEKAEREAKARQAHKERRGEMIGHTPRTSPRKSRRPLHEVVAESKRRLTPEQLFAEAGFTPEVVEDFYEELRREIKTGHIEQVRPDYTKIYLIAANS